MVFFVYSDSHLSLNQPDVVQFNCYGFFSIIMFVFFFRMALRHILQYFEIYTRIIPVPTAFDITLFFTHV